MDIERRLIEAMSPPDESKFISIGGATIKLEDFIKIWNGEYTLPDLPPEEIDQIDYRYYFGTYTLSGLIHTLPEQIFGRRIANAGYQTVAKATKFLEIRGAITRYKESHPTSRLSMHRVLSAIKDDKLKFSTIAEFAASLPGTEPTEQHADHVENAVSAVAEQTDAQVNYVTAENAQIIDTTVDQTRQDIICKLLGIKPKAAKKIPLFILERLAFEVPPTEDDIRELSRLNNIGSHPLVTGIQAAQLATFFGGFGLFVHGISQVPHDIVLAQSEIIAGTEIFALGAWIMLLYPTKAREIAASLASSNNRHRKQYKKLSKKIDRLKQSIFGKTKITALRELIREIYGANTEASNLIDQINRIEEDEEIAEFNNFANTQGLDFNDPSEVSALFKDFQDYKDTLSNLEEELSHPSTKDNSTTVRQRAQSVKN